MKKKKISKPGNQECQWCHSVQIQRPEIHGGWWHKSQTESKCPHSGRTRSTNVWGQKVNVPAQAKWANLSSTILFYSGPHLDGAWPHWWRFSWLSLPIQTLSSSRNSLSDTPRYNASPLGPQHSPLSIGDCDRNFYNKISSSQEPQWWRSCPLVTDQGRKSKHLVSLGTQIFIKPGRVAV